MVCWMEGITSILIVCETNSMARPRGWWDVFLFLVPFFFTGNDSKDATLSLKAQESSPNAWGCLSTHLLGKCKGMLKSTHLIGLGLSPQNVIKKAWVHSGKLTWQWKIPIFSRECIFKRSIFHCHVSLPVGNFEHFSSKWFRTCFGMVSFSSEFFSFWKILRLLSDLRNEQKDRCKFCC